ncbi:MAG: kinase/pyrophosphorylase [Firmicutes bacterium]|nr:kinase/pyrophosphorylase [Bacillota bacterium]
MIQPIVYVVSDAIGETAELVTRAAVSQFNSGHVEIRRVSHVSSLVDIHRVVEEAHEAVAAIIFTIVLPELREALKNEADALGIPNVDIMGPVLTALSTMFQAGPRLKPGLVHKMDEEYFRRVEAVEYTVKYDDGKDARGLERADAVLVGVSRSSKTPVSLYLAQRGYKVANFPLVPEVPPPKELFSLSPGKVVGLTVSPRQLQRIRVERLKALGLSVGASYADPERILRELEYADGVFRRLGCSVVDVTDRAVEETASLIVELLKRESKA